MFFLALDRGTVDGFTWPVAEAYTRYGWQDVTKYIVDEPMYRSGGSLAMNLDAWNDLSPEIHDILLEAAAEVQEWGTGFYAEKDAMEFENIRGLRYDGR